MNIDDDITEVLNSIKIILIRNQGNHICVDVVTAVKLLLNVAELHAIAFHHHAKNGDR